MILAHFAFSSPDLKSKISGKCLNTGTASIQSTGFITNR